MEKFAKLTYKVVRTKSYSVIMELADSQGVTVADGQEAVLQTLSEAGKIPEDSWVEAPETKISISLIRGEKTGES